MKPVISSDYKALFVRVKERIRSGQYAALKAVNRELISLYWDLGGLLSSRGNGSAWGKAVVETLARDLQREFPGLELGDEHSERQLEQALLARVDHFLRERVGAG